MLFDGEAGFDQFLALASRVGQQILKKVEQGFICDALILRECFLSAGQSITFHGPGESANHFKEAGHCCFWIAKLKPLDSTLGISEFAAQLFRQKGGAQFFRQKDAAQKAAKSEKSKLELSFPANELFGLFMGHTIVIEGLDYLRLENLKNGNLDKSNKIAADIKYNNDRFGIIAARLVKSLRMNNYTARAMATTFEWAYFNEDE